MAKDNPSSQSPGRQQTSDMAQSASSAQQGANQRTAGQQSGWQSSDKNEPSTGSALQQRRGTSQSPSLYYGSFGGGPLSVMRRITEDMDRLFESFGFGRGLFPTAFGQDALTGYGEGASSLWTPHIEVSERDGKFFVSADLPGVKKEDVKVEITQDAVTIQGQRKQEKTSSEGGFYRSERSYGSFYRTIPLPEGAKTENASATFRDGVLQIEIETPPKKSSGRTLEIKDAATGETTSRSATSESQQMAGGKAQQQR